MADIENVNDKNEGVNYNLEKDKEIALLRKEILKSLSDYRDTISFLAADAPIQVLCLPKKVEKILSDGGYVRVVDIFNMDLTKIEGLDAIMIRNLAARLNEFLSVF